MTISEQIIQNACPTGWKVEDQSGKTILVVFRDPETGEEIRVGETFHYGWSNYHFNRPEPNPASRENSDCHRFTVSWKSTRRNRFNEWVENTRYFTKSAAVGSKVIAALEDIKERRRLQALLEQADLKRETEIAMIRSKIYAGDHVTVDTHKVTVSFVRCEGESAADFGERINKEMQ